MEVSLLVGIAPLFVLGDGERERGVEHGVHDVDEGDVGDDGAEEIGAQVGDGAHQQAAGRAAFDGDARGVAVAGGGEVLDGGDEVGEGVALDEHFAGVVPGLAEVAAAADVRIGHDDAAIEQAEAVGAEAERQRVAVGAVAVDVEGIAAGLALVFAIDEGDGDLDAVGGGGVDALAGVERAVEAAGNFKLLEERGGAGWRRRTRRPNWA